MAQLRDPALDRLRVFLTLSVVAFHAALAYIQSGFFDPQNYLLSRAPVVDSERWLGFDLYVLFNDSHFMALMFLISGLFVWPSLARKGAGAFLKDRLLRLGLPFAVIVLTVMPLAYYPSFRLTGADISLGRFWWNMLSVGPWPAGPAWFIWLLLALDVVAAAIWCVTSRSSQTIGSLSAAARRRPAVLFATLFVFSALAYFAMALPFGDLRWLTFGPFAVQASRLLFYAVYFFVGVVIGAGGTESLSSGGWDLGRWDLWLTAGLASFVMLVVLVDVGRAFAADPPPWWLIVRGAAFIGCCAALCFAFTAMFLRFAKGPASALDLFRDESYGIYLVHYVFVVWLQYLLLGFELAAAFKAAIVFVAGLTLSWISIAGLRRINWVARII